jgi:hypothetical protein
MPAPDLLAAAGDLAGAIRRFLVRTRVITAEEAHSLSDEELVARLEAVISHTQRSCRGSTVQGMSQHQRRCPIRVFNVCLFTLFTLFTFFRAKQCEPRFRFRGRTLSFRQHRNSQCPSRKRTQQPRAQETTQASVVRRRPADSAH